MVKKSAAELARELRLLQRRYDELEQRAAKVAAQLVSNPGLTSTYRALIVKLGALLAEALPHVTDECLADRIRAELAPRRRGTP